MLSPYVNSQMKEGLVYHHFKNDERNLKKIMWKIRMEGKKKTLSKSPKPISRKAQQIDQKVSSAPRDESTGERCRKKPVIEFGEMDIHEFTPRAF